MSHTSKKCRKIWQFIGIFMLTCVVSVLPASLAGAQRATKSTVAQMEKRLEDWSWIYRLRRQGLAGHISQF